MSKQTTIVQNINNVKVHELTVGGGVGTGGPFTQTPGLQARSQHCSPAGQQSDNDSCGVTPSGGSPLTHTPIELTYQVGLAT